MMCLTRGRPRRLALCVGVNKYRHMPGSNLQGCVTDARDMGALLRSRGYKVTTLTDSLATRRAIIAHLRQMVRSDGWEHAVFSMSSHGTQVADASGDEPDWLDEAVCPHDLCWAGGRWQNAIIDDEFAELFDEIPDGRVLDVFLDTCHSGTGIRVLALVGGSRPRYLPPPTIEAYARIERAQASLRPQLRLLGDNVVLWAACRANQYATDAYIGGRYRGAFTASFLASYAPGLSRSSMMATTVEMCRRYGQTPQLETKAPLADAAPWG
jgi:metacaspase-1